MKDETSSAPKQFVFDPVKSEQHRTIVLVCCLVLTLGLLPSLLVAYFTLGYGQLVLVCFVLVTALPILLSLVLWILNRRRNASGSRRIAWLAAVTFLLGICLTCGPLAFAGRSQTFYFSLHETEYNAVIGLIQSGSLQPAKMQEGKCSPVPLPLAYTSLAADGTVCVQKSKGMLNASFTTWYALDYPESYVYRSDDQSPAMSCRRLPAPQYWFTC